MSERPKTIQYMQWLRALGAVGIVVLHAFVTLQVAAPDGAMSPVRLAAEEAVGIICARWAVPVFFMISGALMLDPAREMGWKKTLRHAWRLLFVLLTIGFVFCVVESADTHGTISPAVVWSAFIDLIQGESWDHLWYVYTLLGFYLMTPILRPWFAAASREELGKVTLAVALLLLGVRALPTFTPYKPFYNVLGLPYCFAYYFMGPCVVKYVELDRCWTAAGMLSLVFMLWVGVGLGDTRVSDPIRGFVAPYAILVLLLAKCYLDRPMRAGGMIELLARDSFGIYILHPVFQHLMTRYLDPLSWPAVASDVALSVVPLVLSIAATHLLRRLPGFADKL